MYAWGYNGYGDLGNGTTASSSSPEQISSLSGATAIASGWSHHFALEQDGTLRAWGDSGAGELGAAAPSSCNGVPCSLIPGSVNGLTGVVAVAAGGGDSVEGWGHTLALRQDGTVWAWGNNDLGQLGNGTVTSTSTPVQVLGPGGTGYLTGIVAIAAGGYHSLALARDGTIWGWGSDGSGQLATTTTTTCQVNPPGPCSLVPVHALAAGLSAPFTGVIAIAGGEFTSVVLRNDGTVWTLGNLGAAQVPGPGGNGYLSNMTAIAAGWQFEMALKSDGTVWTWGYNVEGQLGNGATSDSTTPVQVVGAGKKGFLTGITAVAAGLDHALALRADGTVWAWGGNGSGQLGASSKDNCGSGKNPAACSTSPLQVAGAGGTGYLTGVTAIAAGSSVSYAATTLLTQLAPAGTQYNDAPYAGTSDWYVQTFTGAFAYTYSHTDLAIAGRGPSPTFVRSYNSNDTRVGPLGPGWTDNYAMHLANPGDGTGDLILEGAQGRSDRYTLSGSTYTPPPAVYTTLVRTGNGTYVAAAKDQTAWTFDGAGHLIAIVDRYGNSTTLTYNASGQLVSMSDPAGRGSLTLGYNGSGLLASVTDWLSRARSVQFGYDASGRLQTVTDRDGQTTTYGYDSSNRLTSITDANHHAQLTISYDASGRVQTQQDALGNQTSYSYGANTTTITAPTTSLEPSWHPVVTDTYDTSGRLMQRVSQPSSAETYTEQFAYDSNFDLTAHTDARGNVTVYCYDVDYSGAAINPAAGNLTRVIAPAPASGGNVLVSLTKYDGKNNVIETVPPKGVASGASATCSTNVGGSVSHIYATDSAYDASGVELLSVTRQYTDPDLGLQTATTKYEYGDAANPGLVTRIIPPRGNTASSPDYSYATTNTYYTSGSQAGMPHTTADALGHTMTYTYDAAGRRLTTVDPDGGTWATTYDNEDRLLTAATPAVNGSPLTTQYQYDVVGNRNAVIDANGQVTKYLYDARNNLGEVDQSPNIWTDPNATPSPKYVTAYAYDNQGNLTRATRDQGDSTGERATDYLYDGAGHLRRMIQYPNWPSTSPQLVTATTYDGNGNHTSTVSPLNQTTTLSYDSGNRLTSITYSDGVTPNVTLAYDASGNRLTMTDGAGTTSSAYDEFNRLTSVTNPGSVTVGWRYDLDGNRTKLLYPAGAAVTYTFDKAGRVSGVTDWAGRTTSYGYYPDGHLQTSTNVNGTTATYTQDAAQRLTQVTNQLGSTILDQHTYTLDSVGNRTQRTETLLPVGGGQPVTTTTNYSLDRLYQLTADGTAEAFTYDPVGNRLTLTAGSQQTAYTYDRADRILSAGTITYTVDADGNLTARGNDTFSYDQANRLTRATVAGVTSTNVYNGDGVRMSQTVGGTTTNYVYDTNGALPVVLLDGTRSYVYGNGLAYSVDSTNAVAVYHTDGVGSVRALTDGSGTLVQTYQTDAFGVPTASQGTSSQPFGFTGQQQDSTGLVDLRARYYDPTTGRFLTQDTDAGDASEPLSLNRFIYAQNNPGLNTDPSGHCLPVCAIAVVAACVSDPACDVAVGAAAYAIVSWLQAHPPSLPQVSAPDLSAAGSPMGTPEPDLGEQARRHALGTDESGQYRQAEETAGVDLEDVLGQRVQRFNSNANPYKAGDWFDANGTTYDGVGPAPSEYFDLARFTNQIDQHLLRQGVDKVFVDLRGLVADQSSAVRGYVDSLTADQQGRIIMYP